MSEGLNLLKQQTWDPHLQLGADHEKLISPAYILPGWVALPQLISLTGS